MQDLANSAASRQRDLFDALVRGIEKLEAEKNRLDAVPESKRREAALEDMKKVRNKLSLLVPKGRKYGAKEEGFQDLEDQKAFNTTAEICMIN